MDEYEYVQHRGVDCPRCGLASSFTIQVERADAAWYVDLVEQKCSCGLTAEEEDFVLDQVDLDAIEWE